MSTIVDIEELGRRIRKLRVDRRMTLKQVEQACGLSATHLSEIERGRTSPTIGALVRIARALEKDPSYFIEAEEREDVAHVLREQLRPETLATGVRAEELSPGVPGTRLFSYKVRIEPGARGLDVPAEDLNGDVIYYVQSGELIAGVDGREVRLGRGDALQSALDEPHRLRASGPEPVEMFVLCTRALEASR